MGDGQRSGPLRSVWLGRLGFEPALALQQQVRDAVVAGEADETLLLVEHPAVLTLGRRGERSDILWTDAQLAARGIALCETPRGGQVTLHAPGQLVAYPVVRIGFEVRRHVTRMGQAAVTLLESLGVQGARCQTQPLGVWHDAGKIGSMGVHVSRGVTVQGIAINLDVERALFGALVSCGMPTATMVSATDVGGRAVAVEDAAHVFAEAFARSGAWTLVPGDRDALG